MPYDTNAFGKSHCAVNHVGLWPEFNVKLIAIIVVTALMIGNASEIGSQVFDINIIVT
jgi:hypothetical protein